MGFLLISAHYWVVLRAMKNVLGVGGRWIGKGQGSSTEGEGGGGGGDGSLIGEGVGVEVGLEEGLAWVSVLADVSARVYVGCSSISPNSKGSRRLL